MTPEQIGIVGCVALVVLLCSSVPVAIAMAVVGFAGFAAVVSLHPAVSMLTFDVYKTLASYSLTVIPLFVLNLGYDPIWLGVMIVLVTQMGVITPPVGVCVYVISGMEREVPLETMFRGALPFLAAMAVVAILLILFPDIALILPRWIHP